MGVKSVSAAILAMKGLFVDPMSYSVLGNEQDGGGLRRKRSGTNYVSESESSRRRLSIDEDLQRFFLAPKQGSNVIDEIDMRQLLVEMEVDMSIEPTFRPTPLPTVAPTPAPTESLAPTLTNCENEGTCQNRLRGQIYDVSVRVGTTAALDDPNSPQSRASAWIVEECDADPPIDPCDIAFLNLNEQRYALAVMYFSLGGDDWNNGANPGQDAAAPAGQWMSGLNYCEWGAEISGEDGNSYNQLVCDEFGNVLNLNLRESN
eukprot:scaffold289406_cov103-Cyclotella_meneghiniana.AAC.1